MLGGDRQAKAAAAGAARRLELAEPLEDVRQPIGRDAGTPVGHGHRDRLAERFDRDRHVDTAAMLAGVVKEVPEDPFEPPRVGVDLDGIAGQDPG